MRLKRLQLQGFKSFADKTDLFFDEGIAGIVGPNGCGKSNTVDAIRWVMGEQSAKGLRGNEMSDVIFSGTTARKGAGFAEVSLTFDNTGKLAPEPYTDNAEIMITRRLYRTGESEYLINNVTSRLKDITDLFLGTGSSAKAYYIVQQGKIDEIVLAKPEDRRFMIEEAAGIAKYKARKVSAERRMESTKQNLSRVEDILRELERTTRSLERQVERAEKYRTLQRELRSIDEQVVAAKVTRLDQEAAKNETELNAAKDELTKVSTELQEIEAEIEKHRLEALNQEKITSTDYEKLLSAKEELSGIDTEIELSNQKVVLLSNQIEERQKDIERVRSKWTSQSEEMREMLAELEKLRAQKEAQTQGIQDLKAQVDSAEATLAEQESSFEEVKKQLDEKQKEEAKEAQKIEMYRKERIDLEFRRSEVERSLEEITEKLFVCDRDLGEATAKSQDFESRVHLFEQEVERARSSQEKLRRDLETNRRTKEEISEKLSAVEAEIQSLETLEEHQVGYSKGALRHRESSGEPFILDQLKFRPEYAKAGEGFLAEFGQAFVGADTSEEVDAARWMRLFAVATHDFPLSLADAVADDCEINNDLIRVLEAIEIVDQIPEKAAAHAQVDHSGRCRFPISLGVYFESRGEVLTEESPAARMQEVEGLRVRAREGRAEIAELDQARQAISERIKDFEVKESEVSARLKEERQFSSEHLEAISNLKADIRELASKKEQFETEIEKLDSRVRELEALIKPLEASGETEELKSRLGELQTSLERARSTKEEVAGTWIERRIEFGALQERVERLEQQTVHAEMTKSEYEHNERTFQSDIDTWSSDIEALKARATQLVQDKETKREFIDSVEKGLAEARDILNRSRSEVEQREVDRKSIQSTKDAALEKVQEFELQRQELRHLVEELDQMLGERYQVGVQEVLANVQPEDLERLEDETVLRALEVEAKELREKLNKFGEVNLLALQEYEETKKRLDFMVAQKEDLLKTLDNLQSIIDRINSITEFRFRETFKAINHNFQLLFPKLFGGGRAYMKLTDEHNLLETGVEIFAEPPGKKVQVMSLLSGGEKAMTGISLLFALFSYRPASFCILDEVDAPLDEANTGRFNEIVHEMSGLSQFIVITHNKRTMEIVDKLFGVTMQEPGVSRLVGVALSEAQAFAASEAS